MKKVLILVLFSFVITSCLKKVTCTCKKRDGSVDAEVWIRTSSKKDRNEWKDKCRNTETTESEIVELSDGTYTTVTYVTPCELH